MRLWLRVRIMRTGLCYISCMRTIYVCSARRCHIGNLRLLCVVRLHYVCIARLRYVCIARLRYVDARHWPLTCIRGLCYSNDVC